MKIHCNAGIITANMIGDLPGYGSVWYHPNGTANILSLACVKEHGFRVTYRNKMATASMLSSQMEQHKSSMNPPVGCPTCSSEITKPLHSLKALQTTALDTTVAIILKPNLLQNYRSSLDI
jgi:hypothetical protein